jgi:hypothetical protein
MNKLENGASGYSGSERRVYRARWKQDLRSELITHAFLKLRSCVRRPEQYLKDPQDLIPEMVRVLVQQTKASTSWGRVASDKESRGNPGAIITRGNRAAGRKRGRVEPDDLNTCVSLQRFPGIKP